MRVVGGCHCGAVRFAAEVADEVELLDCNCSICSKVGYLHLIVPEADFTLVSGQAHLTEYRFGTATAVHLFCRTCGVKPFYRPRSHPGAWSVNFGCLDGDVLPGMRTVAFDGRNWDQARASI